MSIRAVLCAVGLASLLLVVSGCGHESVRLSIASPHDSQTVRTAKVRVHGKVEPADATVRINERPIRLRDGAFRMTVRLHRGRNRINIVAKSSGMTSDIRDIIVRRARTRPEIAASNRRREVRRAAAAARAALRASRRTRAGGSYQPEFRSAFMSGCQGQGNASYCGCTLSYLESHVPIEDLGGLQAELFSGRSPKPLIAAVAACRSRL
jgi:hypothetical protein